MTNHRTTPNTPQSVEPEPIVYVLDDDKDVREGLKAVLDSVHLPNRLLSSTMAFWPERVDAVSCLVLDLRLPGQSGLDFQKELAQIRESGHMKLARAMNQPHLSGSKAGKSPLTPDHAKNCRPPGRAM